MKFKEKLEIVESILTIIVSLIAIYGTIVSCTSGFWTKLNSTIEKIHIERDIKNEIKTILD